MDLAVTIRPRATAIATQACAFSKSQRPQTLGNFRCVDRVHCRQISTMPVPFQLAPDAQALLPTRRRGLTLLVAACTAFTINLWWSAFQLNGTNAPQRLQHAKISGWSTSSTSPM